MKTHVVVACLAMLGSTGSWSAANEPIQPIPPIKVSNPALVELGKKFSPEENAKIVAFLKTLTDNQPSFKLPQLPPSADNTPRPTPFEKQSRASRAQHPGLRPGAAPP